MKRVLSNLFFMLLPFMLCIMSGCIGRGNTTSEAVLTFKNPGDSVFPADVYFQLEKKLNISDEGDFLLSDVTDIFLNGDFAFLLDSRQAISKVDMKTGRIVNQLCQVGRGPQDYLMATNLTGDREHLYLLDYMSKRVHVYDFDLNHEDRFSVEYIPLPSSFVRTKDGFMFLNSSQDKDVGSFVLTDSRGVKKASFLELKEDYVQTEDDGTALFRVIHFGKYFFAGSDDNMVCYDPNTEEMYLYDGKTLNKMFSVKPDDSLFGTRGVNIAKVLWLDGHTLVGYRCDFKSNFAWYDENLNQLAMGRARYVTPRFQIYQSGDRIILVIMAQDLLETEVEGKQVQAQFLVYRHR